jgi:hypothetical protein
MTEEERRKYVKGLILAGGDSKKISEAIERHWRLLRKENFPGLPLLESSKKKQTNLL